MAKPITLVVTYLDGRSETMPLLPIGLVMAERKFGKETSYESSLYTAWAVVRTRPGYAGGEFDDWLATIESCEDEAKETPPLAEAPSPEP